MNNTLTTDKVRCNNCMLVMNQYVVDCSNCRTEQYLMQPFMQSKSDIDSYSLDLVKIKE